MATTIALAASFNIDAEKLESWATGKKPTDPTEAKIAEQIFAKFDYVDGDWRSKTEPEAKKAKTKKTTKAKKKTKAAVSTPSSTAESKTSINSATSVTSVDSTFDKVKTETAKNEAPAESDLKSTQVESDSTSQVTEEAPPADAEKASKTKKTTKTKAKANKTASKEKGAEPVSAETTAVQAQTKKVAATDAIVVAASAKENESDSTVAKQSEVTLTSTDIKADTPVAEKSTESSSKETDKAASTESTEGSNDKDKSDKTPSEPTEPTGPKVLFSAVGIIRGEVTIDEEENQHTVKFGGKTYPLFYARKNYTAYTGLKKEIEASGNANQRLIVYPKFTHFPKRDQPPRVGFQLVGFDKGGGEGVTQELNDNEFKICGLWQFIPVCRQPCISIFRNFTRDRLDYIKQAETQSKVNFMKASHLPILWRDGPVKPFRFNPKLKKEEQAKVYFVEIKAKFLPQRDCFGFSEMLGEPSEKLPKFLKASKKDKAEVQKTAKKNKPPGKGGNARPGGKGKPQNKGVVKPSPKPNKPVKKEA
ncbi:MAG: hypothetical protein QNJ38_19940 [Prochloraceae cyanobacterium]|nr:hypothetical protein [Prochloraceae cyanobacterium]